jgi:hypothetical protein
VKLANILYLSSESECLWASCVQEHPGLNLPYCFGLVESDCNIDLEPLLP